MTKLVVAIALFLSTATAFADSIEDRVKNLRINCKGELYYVPVKLSLDLGFTSRDGFLGASTNDGDDGKEVEFSWSQTECEDIASLTVKNDKLEEFLSGNSDELEGIFLSSEPDGELKVLVTCTKKD
jgi:hypothetical protein